MSSPIIEQIAEAIAAKLATVTVAGGYNVSVSAVLRPTKYAGVRPAPYLAVLTQENPEPADEQVAMHKSWVQPFSIDLYIWPDEHSTEPVDRLYNIFRSDVEKALAELIADAAFRALCENCYLGTPYFMATDTDLGQMDVLRVVFIVEYRTLETDPYSK